jgi:hypothetical protein
MGGGKGVQRAGVEGHVPILVAESSVQPDQSRSAAFVAPGVLSVLQRQLLQLANLNCATKTSHKS